MGDNETTSSGLGTDNNDIDDGLDKEMIQNFIITTRYRGGVRYYVGWLRSLMFNILTWPIVTWKVEKVK